MTLLQTHIEYCVMEAQRLEAAGQIEQAEKLFDEALRAEALRVKRGI